MTEEFNSDIEALEAAARAEGIVDDMQMGRFLLWVGNEAFEGREPASIPVLAARARELVNRFRPLDEAEEIRMLGQRDPRRN